VTVSGVLFMRSMALMSVCLFFILSRHLFLSHHYE